MFSRYGSEMYSNEDYRNDWDGSSPMPTPEGTYCYVIEVHKDGRPTEKVKGWGSVMRRNLDE